MQRKAEIYFVSGRARVSGFIIHSGVADRKGKLMIDFYEIRINLVINLRRAVRKDGELLTLYRVGSPYLINQLILLRSSSPLLPIRLRRLYNIKHYIQLPTSVFYITLSPILLQQSVIKLPPSSSSQEEQNQLIRANKNTIISYSSKQIQYFQLCTPGFFLSK